MKHNKQPLVSVIMPVYNAGDFLVEAIESILGQTYPSFELVIVDDCSTDRSWKIITSYKKRYPNIIRAFRLKKQMNKGGDACANVAFKWTRGTLIARMDADDIARPDRLEKQVAYLQAHPDVMLLGSQARVINHDGEVIGQKSVPTAHEDIYKAYCVFHPIIHPTVMLRRKKLPKRGFLYNIAYSANNDLHTFFEFLAIGRFANLPEALLDYRVHGKNDSLIKPKERFFNTLAIRFHAVMKGYKPTTTGVLINVIQTAVILALPERLIVPLYLYMKGIYTLSITPVVRINTYANLSSRTG